MSYIFPVGRVEINDMTPEFFVNEEFDVCGLPFRLVLTRDFQFV